MAKRNRDREIWEAIFAALEKADGQTLADSTDAVMESLIELEVL